MPMDDIPKVADIVQRAPVIESSTPTASVMALFGADSDLLALPIAENGAFVGTVSRNRLYKALSKAFALDIYNRRPISSLMDKESVRLRPELDIHSALAFLLKSDPALETDSIAVVADGKCVGIVSVSSLMMSISQNQSRLLHMLESLTARIRGEVSQAAQIQQALIPSPLFSFPGIELAAALKTCTEVAGDFYDYLAIDHERLCLAVADVSGHGVQAGMVTTAAKASLHTLIRGGVAAPGRLLSDMNQTVLAAAGRELLMTCLVAIINPARRQIRYASAGHNYPYLFRGLPGAVEFLQSPPGFPLGFDPDAVFEESTALFGPGDTLILYSDGVNECSNGSDDYGYARLEKCLAGLAERDADAWVKGILASLVEFKGDERFEDDVTLLVAQFRDSAAPMQEMSNLCHGECR